jgi:hypothetical protein
MDGLGRIPSRTSKHSLCCRQSQAHPLQLLWQELGSFSRHRPDHPRVRRPASYSHLSIGMFSRLPEVASARVSIAYWKRQSRAALEAQDDTRLQKAFKKIIHWEEVLSALREKHRTFKTLPARGPVLKRRQLPAPPDAPPIEEWVPKPLTWD